MVLANHQSPVVSASTITNMKAHTISLQICFTDLFTVAIQTEKLSLTQITTNVNKTYLQRLFLGKIRLFAIQMLEKCFM